MAQSAVKRRKQQRAAQILEIVRQRQRAAAAGRGVLPVTVVCWLDTSWDEATIREDMVRLWRGGHLARIGGEGARRGYRLPADEGGLAGMGGQHG